MLTKIINNLIGAKAVGFLTNYYAVNVVSKFSAPIVNYFIYEFINNRFFK